MSATMEDPSVVVHEAGAPAPNPTEKPLPPGDTRTIPEQIHVFVTGSKINVLLVFIPLSLMAGWGGWNGGATFIFSFMALIPMAAMLGDLTEDIALRMNAASAALINVTFGNATEVIVSVMALRTAQLDLVKSTMVGSVIGNMMLVLGTALMLGGWKNPRIQFVPEAARTYVSALVMICFCFGTTTAFAYLNTEAGDAAVMNEKSILTGREMSVFMLGIYGAYLYYQQVSHKHLFDGSSVATTPRSGHLTPRMSSTMPELEMNEMSSNNVSVEIPSPETPADIAAAAAAAAHHEDDDEEEEEPQFSQMFAIVATGVVAVLISIISGFLVDSVEPAAETLHISRWFIGMVLIPIVGNVCEHASAILMAMRGKMDIALGVALGSSIQIGLFAYPFVTVAGWFMGVGLDMALNPFLFGTMTLGVLVTSFVIVSGECDWLGGLKLTTAYFILCFAFLNAPYPGTTDGVASS
jgi:Ca2+:H+ antiporter